MAIVLKKEKIQWNENSIINEFRKIHGNRYDYSKFSFKTVDTKSSVLCSAHGEFQITPYKHINKKRGCWECGKISSANNRRISTEYMIKELNIQNNFKYSYPNFEYTHSKQNIQIICPIHGGFTQTLFVHRYGSDCNKCVGQARGFKKRKTHEEFLINFYKIWDKHFEVMEIYETCIKPISIRHDKCKRIFKRTPNSLLNSKIGVCKFCEQSRGEKKLAVICEKYDLEYITQKKFNDCRYKQPLPFDMYLPKFNILIEIDGIQHFRPVNFSKKSYEENIKRFLLITEKDIIKNKYCEKNNIKLLRVPFWHLNELENILIKELKLENDYGHN